jgi:hypothetical protein
MTVLRVARQRRLSFPPCLVALSAALMAGCDGGDAMPGVARNVELAGGDEEPAGAAPMQAWDGGSVPGLAVWSPESHGEVTTPPRTFLERLAATDPMNVVVVRGAVLSMAGEELESPPVASGWSGPHVVTRVALEVQQTVCGSAPRAMELLFLGGKTATTTEVDFDMPHAMRPRDEYVLMLRRGEEEFYLRSGALDLLQLDAATGAWRSHDGELLGVDDVAGACP